MKSVALAALILLVWTAAPRAAAQTGKGSIEGSVVRSGDNSPIEGARVTLVPDDNDDDSLHEIRFFKYGPEAELQLVPPNLSATTDGQGKFALSDVDPEETYRMVVSANGFVSQEYGQQTFPGIGRPIGLKPGQTLKGVRVILTRTGSIEGIVKAESGEPLQDVRIRLLRYVFNGDGRRLLRLVASTTTNDLGKYRLYFLTPGRYYLHAERINMHADYWRHAAAPFAPAFYPGEAEISHASIIEIQPGMNRSGMDFSLSGERLFRIRGQIVDARTGRAIEKGYKLLGLFDLSPDALPGGDGGFGGTLFKSTYSEDSGEFDFRDIPPGRYSIGGSTFGNEEGGTVVLRVDGDVQNVKLPFGPGTTLAGTVRADGRVDLSEQRRVVEIVIQPTALVDDGDDGAKTGGLYRGFEGISSRSFKISDILPGEYRLSIRASSLPEDSYIKEARYGGIDALNQPFQISASDSRRLEIVVAASGTVEGRIVDNKQVPVSGITAVLIPNRLRTRPDLYKTAVAEADGRFEIHGIAPGDYKLFAWEGIEPYSWFDPEVIRRFETNGRAIYVSEASTQSLELKLIPFAP